MKKCIVIVCFIFVCVSALSAENDSGDLKEPEPYTEEEFPEWMHNLRRFEIITLGTLPFTFLATFLVYDFIRYATSGFDRDYALFGSTNPVPYTTEEKIGVVIAACSTSVLIALVDFFIGKARKARTRTNSYGTH
jgi:hypothetical protein